jgi:hypothetical protein
MTIASLLPRRRRVLVLMTATVLLHYGAIGWVGARLGAPLEPAPQREPATIVAALHSAPSAALTPVATDIPAPAPVRKRPSAVPKAPVAASVAAPAPKAVSVAGAAEAVQEVQSAPLQQAEAPPVAEAAPEPEPEPAPAPGYKVSLPPPAELTLDVERVDAKGAHWSGKAVMAWSRSGEAYRVSMVATIRMIVTINLVELTSEGTVGDQGIVPRTLLEKRRSKAQTATHFDAQQKRISFSASSHSQPMEPGTQDKATFPIQLSGIARADPAQLGADIELLVGEEKDASLFRFVVQGQEEIDTPMGRMATWRLTRPPRPGSYSSRLDIWLAPGHEWYPVKLRSTEANGAVTTQTIRKIVVKELGT